MRESKSDRLLGYRIAGRLCEAFGPRDNGVCASRVCSLGLHPRPRAGVRGNCPDVDHALSLRLQGGIVTLRRASRSLRESTVLPSAGRVGDLPTAPPDELKQRLRMRRFLLASLFSVLYLLVLAIFSVQDKVDRETLILACAM